MGELAQFLGVYRGIKKFQGYFFHPGDLKNDIQVEADLYETRWIAGKIFRPRLGAETQIQPQSLGNVLIISMTNIPFLAKAHALLAVGLRLRGYQPLILCSSSSHRAQKYFSIFGLKDWVFWDHWVRNFSIPPEVTRIVDDFLACNPTIQDFKKWKFHGVYVGKLALSTMIRRELQGQFDLTDPAQQKSLHEWLTTTISNVLIAEKLFERYPVAKMFVRDAGYIPNGAIYEVGLNRGADAIRFEHAQMMGQWMVKRYNIHTRGQALFSLSPDTWQGLCEIPLTDEQDQALTNDFIERYTPDSARDLYQYQQGKSLLSREQIIALLELDCHKKTAVVFAHISWDANFFDGEDLFDDFEQWLIETVKIACENPNLNWVVKLHPANVYKLQREGKALTEEAEMVALRRLGTLPDHVKIMHADTPVNTWSLFSMIDYGLTVRGTIGMELPCFGIPVVTAGTGRYNGYGFTIDPQSRKEYRSCLLALHKLAPLSAQQIELARRHAYWVFLRRLASFDEISKMTTRVFADPNHPLHHNLEITADSLDELQNARHFQRFLHWVTGEQSALDFID